jgi:crotonobetainyl-CoA:carnitine CoA-transferase CaiB-like acyl-CoA transferase
VNRNKKSLGLSFAHPEGVDILHELAKNCDVLVENYLPGSLKKYNMDYESIRKLNPRLIYASITGYGQTGPYSNRPGFDVMVEAEFGLMHLTGSRDGPPVKVGVAVTDLTTGLYACNSIMAALLARANTGEGQHLDVCLSDVQTATLANMAESVLISGKRDSGRWGTAHRRFDIFVVAFVRLDALLIEFFPASVVPYQGFKTADGDIFLGGANDRLFGILCEKLGKSKWSKDPKYVTNNERVRNRKELEDLIEAETTKRTTQEWLEILEGSGLPYAAVNDVLGTLNHEHSKSFIACPPCIFRFEFEDLLKLSEKLKLEVWCKRSTTHHAVPSKYSAHPSNTPMPTQAFVLRHLCSANTPTKSWKV